MANLQNNDSTTASPAHSARDKGPHFALPVDESRPAKGERVESPSNRNSAESNARADKGNQSVAQSSSNSTTPDLRSLQWQIEEIINGASDKPHAVHSLLNVAKQLTNAADVCYAFRDRSQQNELGLWTMEGSPIQSSETMGELFLHWSATACATKSVQLNRVEGRPETIATIPVYFDGRPMEALSAALLVPQGQVEPFVVSLQLLATGISNWAMRQRGSSGQEEAKAAAALVELVGKCQSAESAVAAAYMLVEEMQKLVQCDAVALALCQRGNPRAAIVAHTGTHAIDHKSEAIRHLTEAANEAIDRDQITAWPSISSEDQHSSRLHQQLIKCTAYAAVVSHPLETEDEIVGAWLFLGKPKVVHAPRVLNIIRAASPHIASTISLRKQADAGPFVRLKRVVRGTADSRRLRWKFVLWLAALAILMCVPMPHKISCECSVAPTTRRFATVPYNGILLDSQVRPGDLVAAGQVIARMDTRDLRLEKTEAAKAISTNHKEFDRQRANEEIAEAQIARLRADEATAKLDLIQYRIDNSNIRSPIAGIVLQGDLEGVHGAAVQRGQSLFEVAPLDSLEIKLQVPEQDLPFAKSGMPVTARLDGAPGQKVEAALDHLHPRAAATSGRNAFEAKAGLTDSSPSAFDSLRPGMRGTAKLVGSNRPLGWILFHRAHRKLVDFIDW